MRLVYGTPSPTPFPSGHLFAPRAPPESQFGVRWSARRDSPSLSTFFRSRPPAPLPSTKASRTRQISPSMFSATVVKVGRRDPQARRQSSHVGWNSLQLQISGIGIGISTHVVVQSRASAVEGVVWVPPRVRQDGQHERRLLTGGRYVSGRSPAGGARSINFRSAGWVSPGATFSPC